MPSHPRKRAVPSSGRRVGDLRARVGRAVVFRRDRGGFFGTAWARSDMNGSRKAMGEAASLYTTRTRGEVVHVKSQKRNRPTTCVGRLRLDCGEVASVPLVGLVTGAAVDGTHGLGHGLGVFLLRTLEDTLGGLLETTAEFLPRLRIALWRLVLAERGCEVVPFLGELGRVFPLLALDGRRDRSLVPALAKALFMTSPISASGALAEVAMP